MARVVRRSLLGLFVTVVFAIALGFIALGNTSQLNAVRLKSFGANGTSGGQQGSPVPKTTTYTYYTAFWRIDGGFQATIRLKNMLEIGPMTVTPVLYMADGTELVLPKVSVATAGVATVDINRALAQSAGKLGTHLSAYGSAAFRYSYSFPAVLGSMELLNLSRSLNYVQPFNRPMAEMATEHQLEGLWWRRDPGVNGLFVLANASDSGLASTVQALGSDGTLAEKREFVLGPHQTHTFELGNLIASLAASLRREGGLQIDYQGSDLLAAGELVNEHVGYSASMSIGDVDASAAASTSRFAYVGVMIGRPGKNMGFPEGVRFIPYATLRNTSDTTLTVNLAVNYMRGSEPLTVDLPKEALSPREARQIDLKPLLAQSGLADFDGTFNLEVSFTGRPSDLFAAAGSTDQTGNYVFEVEPQGIGQSVMKNSNYWYLGDGFDTMLTAWNTGEKPEDLMVTFDYGDGSGSYKVPLHLASKATANVDLMELVMAGKPDPDGALIPPNVRQGSARFADAKDETAPIHLAVSAGVYNPKAATCGAVCTSCCGYTNQVAIPSPLGLVVNLTGTDNASATYCNGNQVYVNSYVSSWSSSSTRIATISNSGSAKGISVGSVTMTAYLQGFVVYTGNICGSTPPPCPTANPQAQGSANVSPSITLSQSPKLWYFGGQNPPGFTGGAITATVTATLSDGETSGTFNWSVVAGTDKVLFSNNSLSATTSTNQVTIKSTDRSTSQNDVQINVSWSSGSYSSSASYTTQVYAPYKLVSDPAGSSNAGASSCSVPAPYGTHGYQSLIGYSITDNFGGTVIGAGINEFLGAKTTSNWPGATAGGYLDTNGKFADNVCAVNQTNPSSINPQSPLSTTLVDQTPQNWCSGSTSVSASPPCTGAEVQTDTINRYIDHATHVSITSPVL